MTAGAKPAVIRQRTTAESCLVRDGSTWDATFPITGCDNVATLQGLEFSCPVCAIRIEHNHTRWQIARWPGVIDIYGIGACAHCGVGVPLRVRWRADMSLEWIDESGEWRRSQPHTRPHAAVSALRALWRWLQKR